MTTADLIHVACPSGPQQALCRQKVAGISTGGVRVSFVLGPAREGSAGPLSWRSTPSITTQPLAPTSLVNFGEAVNFPLIFGAMLAVFGAATLAHLLVVSVSRRRREVGLLEGAGLREPPGRLRRFPGRPPRWPLVGVVLGVPLGLVVGRTVWNAFANNLGVVPVAVVPFLLTAAITVGVLVGANLIAIAPAWVATRSKPSDLLRPVD